MVCHMEKTGVSSMSLVSFRSRVTKREGTLTKSFRGKVLRVVAMFPLQNKLDELETD